MEEEQITSTTLANFPPPAGTGASQAHVPLDCSLQISSVSKLLVFSNYWCPNYYSIRITSVQITSQFELLVPKSLVNSNY
jgi:hypothetical protein